MNPVLPKSPNTIAVAVGGLLITICGPTTFGGDDYALGFNRS